MRKNILRTVYIAIFVTALVLTIIAFIQTLRPIVSIMNSYKRIAGVATTPEQAENLLNGLRPYRRFAFIFSVMYIPAVLFFAYMSAVHILAVCRRQMPRFILPAAATVNTVLLLTACFMVNNVGGGLGLAQKFESAANYYSWYNAPVFPTGSNIYYFAPAFYTLIMPLLFLGVLPLTSGTKALFQRADKKGDNKPPLS
jgi:hypothetical protein